MQIVVRTADRIHQGKLDLDPGVEAATTVGDLVTVLRDNFKLPATTDYFIRSDRLGSQLDARLTLIKADVKDGDVLEIAPILQAGYE